MENTDAKSCKDFFVYSIDFDTMHLYPRMCLNFRPCIEIVT